jgi:hypothetical protein
VPKVFFFFFLTSDNSILLHSGPESSLTFLVVNEIFWLSEDEISWEYFRVYSRTILQVFEIFQGNSLKCSILISFLGNKKNEFKLECLV